MITVVDADSPARIAAAQALFVEYAATPDVSVCVQDYAAEVSGLPGKYAPPAGALLLALDDGRPVGCVALRALEPPGAEMKRLYVRPDGRGKGVGEALVRELIGRARSTGYATVRLDTLPSMTTAQAMYRRLGFRIIPPYPKNPIPGASHYELTLSDDAS
jgi:ribosomal protein S18 acetylase RimI-like enzyme